jgi:SAM-dependent methyltransferase
MIIRLIFGYIFLLLFLRGIHHYRQSKQNTFEGFNNFIDNYVDPFDDVYVKLYSKVFNNIKFMKYNLEEIYTTTMNKKYTSKQINILDTGCGSGLVHKLLNDKYNILGVDRSNYFIRLAKIQNPLGDFITDDLKNVKLSKGAKYTHIFSFLDTLYHNNVNDMNIILANYNFWLQKGGYLCIHIFNKDKLDPSPREFSQYLTDKKYKYKHAVTYFNTFSHEAWWEPDTNDNTLVKYNEKFIMKNGNKIKHTTELYIPPVKDIIKLITSQNFKLVNIINFDNFEINDIELYIFKKK